MRMALALTLLATPLHAWEFTPTPICTITGGTDALQVTVTHDPRAAQAYAITLTREPPWPAGPVFSIRFDGPRRLTISTDRHQLSEDGQSLTVRDRGFGNVLTGLEAGGSATALIGGQSGSVDLTGADGPVRKFRACVEGGVA